MSFQIKKILVPVDFSETGQLALEHASFLARLSKAEILLVHVLPLNEYHFEIPERIMYIDNREELNKMLENKLEETAEMVRKNYGITPRTMLTQGRIAMEIVGLAREEKADLIVMGTHGAKGFEEIFLGSNAYKVVNIAPCPVITVQTHAKKLGFSNVVLPIDRSTHSREKVETCIDLAQLYGAKIHIVGLLEDTSDHEEGKLNVVLDQVQHAIEHAKLPFSRHILKGDHLAAEALRYGSSVNADLIMIMTDHESALTGLFMGPLAKQIVNHSRIPVMSIHPHYREGETYEIEGVNRFY